MTESFQDFLGNVITVGSYIVYASGSGHSKNTTLGQILSITLDGDKVKSVKVQPIKSSRWSQHGQRSHYYDQNGKEFNPYKDEAKEHYASGGHYVHSQTGENLGDDYYTATYPNYNQTEARLGYAYNRGRYDNPRPVQWVRIVWKDYVTIVKDPIKPVTLTVVENVVAVNYEDKDPDGGDPGL